MQCSSCPDQSNKDLIAFEHFFAAGTISLPLSPRAGELTGDIDHRLAEDGWHPILSTRSIACHTSIENDLLEALEFLLKYLFIKLTYYLRPTRNALVLRVYLVPCDLPGSKGKLSFHARDENKVIKPFRKHFRTVFARLRTSASTWHGCDVDIDRGESFWLPHEDQRSLNEIFNSLTTVSTSSMLPAIPHLRTALYPYQQESVACMLAREGAVQDIDDPLYIPIIDMRKEVFYFQPATMELLLSRPRRSQVRGGILCEELGTGKTVMTLALILATLDHIAQPPEHSSRDVMTPLALRHFPCAIYSSARDAAFKSAAAKKEGPGIPSLVEMLMHHLRVTPDKTRFRASEDMLEDRQLWLPLMSNTPFYLHSEPILMSNAPRRRLKIEPPRVMYLTNATMVVIPRTLQAQWTSEILKHCSSSIRTLVIKQKTEIPPPHRLASDYDIVLIRDTSAETHLSLPCFLLTHVHSGISIEVSRINIASLNVGYTCRCTAPSRVRVPDCTCLPPPDVSPLLQVRWKRLIRDEGHNAAIFSTGLNHFLKMLSAERRWIITGTPTTNLLGLNFGSGPNSDEAEADGERQVTVPEDDPLILRCSAKDVSVDPENMLIDTGAKENGNLNSLSSSYAWGRTDREDLRKLGNMMAFLGVLPFATDGQSFDRYVTNPLFGIKEKKAIERKSSPLPGAMRVLEQVMSSCMIRHRIADVEKDVQLPPVREEVILLDLDKYSQMTYNIMMAFICVNAVDSERKDIDYLFHPSNIGQLALFITNLQHCLFWRVDEEALDYELPDRIYIAEHAIKHAKGRDQPDEDIRLVEQSIVHLRKAFDDRLFRDIQHGLEIPYRILQAPDTVIHSFGISEDLSLSQAEDGLLIFPSYAIGLRDAVLRQPLIHSERLAQHARLMREKDRASFDYREAHKPKRARAEDRSASEKRKREKKSDAGMDKMKLNQVQRTLASRDSVQEKYEEYGKAQHRLRLLAEADELGVNVDLGPSSAQSDVLLTPALQLLRNSPYAKMQIGNSMSSKLNYILNEVIKYASTEKILIFSSLPFNLVHISEGLELLGIKHLSFMGTEHRDQWLTTFETSDTYRVFLMELKYGARGLNIVSASRVIFCEPVWRPDVESQAIKRVHRIGQTLPVTVKTLAIRLTYEEYMIQRRREVRGPDKKVPGMVEEVGIRHYLQNPTFLEDEPQSVVNLRFPLLQLKESGSPSTSEDSDVEMTEATPPSTSSVAAKLLSCESPAVTGQAFQEIMDSKREIEDSCDETAMQRKKRRKVHFT